eukprot:CAMPEP_0185737792 /NCGR_PEP_ID=MMETSP1171-20130828/31290_1 /TAXON_ID=374046 /ORGANISM="Helicotheca tamensis, Strain CCMP826" /LENGTH=109 /DNA_ID=CAMNT_0028408801 /DNA_START=483 /DNA_END=812 /DNA_ORIENTATION=-
MRFTRPAGRFCVVDAAKLVSARFAVGKLYGEMAAARALPQNKHKEDLHLSLSSLILAAAVKQSSSSVCALFGKEKNAKSFFLRSSAFSASTTTHSSSLLLPSGEGATRE